MNRPNHAGDSTAMDLLGRLCAGRWPALRVLASQKIGEVVYLAIESLRDRACLVAQIGPRTLRWWPFPNAATACRTVALLNDPMWRPTSEANLGGLVLLIEAGPCLDYGPASHRTSIRVPTRQAEVASLHEARVEFASFVAMHDLGAGNLTSRSGGVLQDGRPFARVSFTGRLWMLRDVPQVPQISAALARGCS